MQKLSQEYVKKSFEKYNYEILENYSNSSTPILCKCSNGHLIKIRPHNFIVMKQRCKICYHIRQRIYSLNENYFEKIDTSNKAYVVGFIHGDGNISLNKNLRIKIQEKDIEILEFIKKELQSGVSIKYSIEHKKNKESKLVSLLICSKKMINDLQKLNIIERKTYAGLMPIIPQQFWWDFIRGFQDADGSVMFYDTFRQKYHIRNDYKRCAWQITSYTKAILEEVVKRSNIQKYCITETSKHVYNILTNNHQELERLYYLIYKNTNNFYLKRKHDKFKQIIEYIHRDKEDLTPYQRQFIIENIRKKPKLLAEGLGCNYKKVKHFIARIRTQSKSNESTTTISS